jgi:hypothetical protein
MSRLMVHAEGPTEELFVNEYLSQHLLRSGFERVDARIIGSSHFRDRRGGIRAWEPLKKQILRHLWSDLGAVATLFVDFYALPENWPGRTEASAKQGASRKAEHVEAALWQDLVQTAGSRFDSRRFVPFVAMHEFEGLLFSDPEKFANAIGRPDLAASFTAIREEFETPEEINDSRHTAPSKRILELHLQYEKPLMGTVAAIGIGLSRIRSECPHFHDWLTRLEALPVQLKNLPS